MSKLKKILIFVATTLILFLGSIAFANAQTNITQGGTGLSSYTAGDMLFFNSGLKFNKLGIGTAGQCLIVSAGLPAWGSCSAGSGDISAVGDVTSGDAFTGTQGTQLTFNNAGGDGIFSYDGTDFNFDKSISLGTAGVRLAGDGDGAFTITGLGNGADENLTLNLDDHGPNVGKYTSSSGLSQLYWDTISLYGQNSGGSAVWLLSHNGSSYFGNGTGGTGRVGFGGVTSPTAKIHIGAGTTSALTAPLKFTAGTNMTTPEAGAVEFDGTSLYYTDSTPTRRTLAHTGIFKTINGNSIIGSGDLTITSTEDLDDVLTNGNISGNSIFITDSGDGETTIDPGSVSVTDNLFEKSALLTYDRLRFADALSGFGDIVPPVFTSNRTWTLPNISGTFAMTSDIPDISGKLDASAYDDATSSEVNTGTSTAKYVSPDSLAGSNYGTRVVSVLINNATALTTGDGKAYIRVPDEANGFDLVGIKLARVSGTGTPLVQIHNVTQATDMLTTRVSIDSGETDSNTATTPAVIDTANDDVAGGDRLRIDVDDAGTSSLWVEAQLTFRLP